MRRAQDGLAHGERPRDERFGGRILPMLLVQSCQVGEADGLVRMSGAQRFLVNRQHPLVKRLGLGLDASVLVERGEVDDRGGGAGVIEAQYIFVECKRT
jgi:hypothetical protein